VIHDHRPECVGATGRLHAYTEYPSEWAWALRFWTALGVAAAVLLVWTVSESRAAVYLADRQHLLSHVRRRRQVSGDDRRQA